MSDDSASIEVQGFERIDAAAGTALLRIAATGTCPAGVAWPPALVIASGRRRHRFAPLPAPPDPEGVLRAAYSAPTALLDRVQAAFALELSDSVVLDLPQPTTRRPRDVAPAVTARRNTRTIALLKPLRLGREAERRAAARKDAIDVLERRLQGERSRCTELDYKLVAAAIAQAQALARWEQAIAAGEHAIAAPELERTRALAIEAQQAHAALEQTRAALQSRIEAIGEELASARPSVKSRRPRAARLMQGRNGAKAARRPDLGARASRPRRASTAPSTPRPRPQGPTLAQASAVRAPAVQGRRRPARRRSRARELPYQALLGICLLLLGITVAVLFVSGAVKVGFAP